LETYRKGAKVTMVIRGSEISPRVKYWVKPDIENRILFKEIDVYYNSSVRRILENEVELDTPDGTVRLPNDFVLALTGYQPNFSFLKRIGITIPDEAPRIPEHNPETMETNIEGLYLAGVVCGGLNTHLWFIENSRIHSSIILEHIVTKESYGRKPRMNILTILFCLDKIRSNSPGVGNWQSLKSLLNTPVRMPISENSNSSAVSSTSSTTISLLFTPMANILLNWSRTLSKNGPK